MFVHMSVCLSRPSAHCYNNDLGSRYCNNDLTSYCCKNDLGRVVARIILDVIVVFYNIVACFLGSPADVIVVV
jgi:hypothetical protein